MSVTTAITGFIHTSVAGLYQELLASGFSFQGVANRLIEIAENAHAFRQYDRLHEAGEILSNFPLKQYRHIGQFYLVLSSCRSGLGNIRQARPLLERLAIVAPMQFRARAMQLLAATYGTERNPEQELYFFVESLKTGASTFLGLRGIALLKAKEGYHKQALKDLESLYSFARYTPPCLYFDYLNSLAVELGEVGRKYEARNIIQSVVASPYAIAYPEWRETAEELNGPNRSFAALKPTQQRRAKILSMPVIEHAGPIEWHKPAPVISLKSWKAKMGNKGERLDSRDLLLRVVELSTAPGMTDGKLLQVVQYMYELLTEPPEPDNDDDKLGA